MVLMFITVLLGMRLESSVMVCISVAIVVCYDLETQNVS